MDRPSWSQAMEILLEQHSDMVGRAVLVQVMSPARSSAAEIKELSAFIKASSALQAGTDPTSDSNAQ